MNFRGWDGSLMDREESEQMLKQQGIEVGHDTIPFAGKQVLIRSRLQPTYHSETDPLFLTMVFGDPDLGMLEYGTTSEEACRQFHRGLVDRYRLVESERQAGTPKALLDGVL